MSHSRSLANGGNLKGNEALAFVEMKASAKAGEERNWGWRLMASLDFFDNDRHFDYS